MKKEQAEAYRPIRTHNLDEQVSSQLESSVKELASLWQRMPKVGDDGESKCLFAESLYTQKLHLEQKVAEKMDTLQEMLGLVEAEIERCRRNVSRAGVDQERLDRILAGQEAASNHTAEEWDYLEVMWRRATIERALQSADETLTASRQKTHPLQLSA